MSTSLKDRLDELTSIELDVAQTVQSAGRTLSELAKDKPSERIVQQQTKTFIKSLEKVEASLSKQINYLSQVASGQPHEGSSYSAQKDAQMAIHRSDRAKVKLAELKRCGDQI